MGFGILRDFLETEHVLRQLRDCEPLEVLAYILPGLPALRVLEFTAPHQTSGYLPNVMSMAPSLQQLSFLKISGEGPFPKVHLAWYHLALTLPSLQTFHGDWIGMDDDSSVFLDWPATLKSIGPSNIKSIFLTRSALKAWEFAVSRIQTLETFMYNYVELQDPVNGHNPASIVASLPTCIKNLAILESDIRFPRERLSESRWGQQRIEKIKSISFAPFRQLQILWCSWAVLVPGDHSNFDLSRVLPQSLEWLALHCIPMDETDILIAAIPRLPRLKKFWVQICRLHEEEHITGMLDPDVFACTQRLAYAVLTKKVKWCLPTEPSPFQPYIEYLDVHQSEDRERD